LVLLAAVVLLAGCSRDLGPKTYTDEVRDNYQKTCVDGSKDKLGDAGAATYCQCTYAALVANVHFDRFKEFETYLRQHVGNDLNTSNDLKNSKYSDIYDLFNACVPVGPTAAGASATTTIPTTTTAR
jgi:hypothetical protein